MDFFNNLSNVRILISVKSDENFKLDEDIIYCCFHKVRNHCVC